MKGVAHLISREISIPKMIECFSALSDPRIDRYKRHKLTDIIAIGLCAMICRAEGPTGMTAFGIAKKIWLMQFLDLSHGVPSHDTFGRVLSGIEPGEFERCLLKWVQVKDHIRRIGEENLDEHGEKKHPARRYVVERTLAWLSKCRGLLIRYEKKSANYLAQLQVASALLRYRRLIRTVVSTP